MPVLRLLAVLLLLAAPTTAAPRPYVLDSGSSSVAFTWTFGPDTVRGRMAVAGADLALDLEDIGASQVSVAVDVTRADAGHPLATQAMTGPRVLDAAAYPTITFQSRRVTLVGDGQARIEGDIAIRGVTRPVTLDARLTTSTPDLSRLTVTLSGVVYRSDFGATGWSDVVGDEVRLDIVAALQAAG
jgi:polyisoprenoid-binding protein YceI